MDYFPAFIDLRERYCLVVGGGEVAARKVALLRRAGGQVRVVAPRLGPSLAAVRDEGRLQHSARMYQPSDLDGVALVVAATDEPQVNARVSADARARQLPVNVVDAPALCTFIVPALVERSSILVAISSGGHAPVLARLLRGRIEAALPERYGELVELCAKLRDRVRARLSDVPQRRRFWEQVLEGQPAELALRGERAAAEAAMCAALERQASGAADGCGELCLIGAGPNDPELVSFRALRWLQRAELVVYDAHVCASIVDLSRRDARRARIDAVLAMDDGGWQRVGSALAAGKRVCVLAPGDVFRQRAGQAFVARARALDPECQVVPGITAPDMTKPE